MHCFILDVIFDYFLCTLFDYYHFFFFLNFNWCQIYFNFLSISLFIKKWQRSKRNILVKILPSLTSVLHSSLEIRWLENKWRVSRWKILLKRGCGSKKTKWDNYALRDALKTASSVEILTGKLFFLICYLPFDQVFSPSKTLT